MTTTGTREPTSGEIPVPSWVNQGENEEIDTDEDSSSTSPGINWGAWAIVAAAMIVAVLTITFFVTRGDDGQAERQQTRDEAMASLQGRFNDPSISPKVNITRIEWVGTNLMIDYNKGDEYCVSQVIIPKENGGLYSIQPIPKVDPSKWGPNVPHCFSIESGNPLPSP